MEKRENAYFVKNLSGIEVIGVKEVDRQECTSLHPSVLVDEEDAEGPYGRVPPPYCSDLR